MIGWPLLVLLLSPGAADGQRPFAGGLGEALADARVTVSGISSGGYAAQQLHLAYSDAISGVGVLAAGPWGCAEGDVMLALGRCAGDPAALPPAGHFAAQARAASAAGAIPPLGNLADDRAWFLHGTEDALVASGVAATGVAFYREFLPGDAVVWVDHVPAGHAFPTVDQGSACARSEAPFVAACGYDAAGVLLAHLHGPLPAPVAGGERALEVLPVDDAAEVSLLEDAYVFVPPTCREAGARCDVHVVLHGCAMSSATLGTAFIEQSGYLEHAAAGGLVLLFPQVRASGANPYGCWDWWGYTGPEYLTRAGAQSQALMKLVNALEGRAAKPRGELPATSEPSGGRGF